jgi:rhodanese-related sulfurtransferase
MSVRRHLLETFTLIAAAVLCAAVANTLATRDRKIALTHASAARTPAVPVAKPAGATPDRASALSRFPPHPDKPFLEISGADTQSLHAEHVLFLDARRTSVFEDGHIAGARNISVWESDLDPKVMALLNEGRDPNAPIVAYCSGGDCEDSHMLAEKLFGVGFNGVLVYKDGWPDWQKRGGPARTGAVP